MVFPVFIHKPLTRVRTCGLMSVNMTFLPRSATFCFLFSGFLNFPLKRIEKKRSRLNFCFSLKRFFRRPARSYDSHLQTETCFPNLCEVVSVMTFVKTLQ